MADRYPHQDLSASAEGYLWDFQQLALRYSLAEVQAMLQEWRLTPGCKFFPRPDECAEFIERQRQKGRAAREAKQRAAERLDEIDKFWAWAAEWMRDTGHDEEELLRRFPSYRGTSASTGARSLGAPEAAAALPAPTQECHWPQVEAPASEPRRGPERPLGGEGMSYDQTRVYIAQHVDPVELAKVRERMAPMRAGMEPVPSRTQGVEG